MDRVLLSRIQTWMRLLRKEDDKTNETWKLMEVETLISQLLDEIVMSHIMPKITLYFLQLWFCDLDDEDISKQKMETCT